MDWKKQAIKWKRAFWAAVTENDDETKERILAARAAKKKKSKASKPKKQKTRTRSKKAAKKQLSLF